MSLDASLSSASGKEENGRLPSGGARRDAQQVCVAAAADDDRRRVARARVAQRARRGIDDHVGGGRHPAARDRLQHAVQALERVPGRMAVERVRAQAGAQLAHERRRPQPVAGDVPDGEADLAARQVDDVVPVAADLVAGREVARRGVDADEVGQAVGQQAALQRDRAAMLAIERVEQPRAVDRGRRLGRGELQQRGVGVGELARSDRADVQHARGWRPRRAAARRAASARPSCAGSG